MNLMRIKYFVEVARWCSFSKAAQALYVSQPNLSRQIALLEQEVGFSLFQRNGKRISLTRAGEYLYNQVRDIPDHIERAVSHAETLSHREVGSLSIGVLEGQDVNLFLSERINSLRKKDPKVLIEMERNSFRNLRHGLDRGTYDVLFTMEFEMDGHPDWDSATLFRHHGAIILSKTHPLAQKENLTFADFRNEPFVAISREESQGGYNLLMQQCAECGFVPNIVREPTTMESLFLCVEMGMGVAMLDRNTRLERNTTLRIIDFPESRTTGLVAAWRKDNRNPLVPALIKALTE